MGIVNELVEAVTCNIQVIWVNNSNAWERRYVYYKISRTAEIESRMLN